MSSSSSEYVLGVKTEIIRRKKKNTKIPDAKRLGENIVLNYTITYSSQRLLSVLHCSSQEPLYGRISVSKSTRDAHE
jgi:hypothetical protein